MRARANYLAALLASLSMLTIAACGGDDKGKGLTSASRGTTDEQRPVHGGAGPSGATGGTSPTSRSRVGRPKAITPQPGTSTGGSAVPPSGSKKKGSSGRAKKKQERSNPEGVRYPEFVGQELGRQARVVCSVLSIDSLVKQYEPKTRKPEDIGRAYAARYPPSVRSEVAAGCAEGIRDQQ